MILWLYAVYINKIDLLPSLIVKVLLGNIFLPCIGFYQVFCQLSIEQHSEMFKLSKGLEMAKKIRKPQLVKFWKWYWQIITTCTKKISFTQVNLNHYFDCTTIFKKINTNMKSLSFIIQFLQRIFRLLKRFTIAR